MKFELSPQAMDDLIDGLGDEGCTDCPDGCEVEPDGYCPHGFYSAMETILRTVA